MAANLKEIIEQLKLERDIIRDGGYGRSVRTPWKATQLFRDSVTCLNFGEAVRKHPCNECLLWEWVPEASREQGIPCHHIPLTDRGETISTLETEDNRDKAEESLLGWLDRTIAELESKLAQQAAGSA